MLRRNLTILAAVGLAVILGTVLQPLSYLQASGVQGERCKTFRETAKTVCGRFLEFWEQNRGLVLFGYPITNPFNEVSQLNGTEYRVQYFERAVFELHPENHAPHDVLLSQLGTFRFREEYPSGEPDVPYVENLPLYPDSRNVVVTRYDIKIPDGDVISMTVFDTADQPSEVLNFYKEVLERNGWLIVRVAPQRLEAVYAPGTQTPPRRGEPVYGLKVDIRASGPSSQVTLSLSKTLPK